MAGDFVAAARADRRLLARDVAAGVARGRPWLLDSREPEEYTGAANPYGVARPGHVPGAVSLP